VSPLFRDRGDAAADIMYVEDRQEFPVSARSEGAHLFVRRSGDFLQVRRFGGWKKIFEVTYRNQISRYLRSATGVPMVQFALRPEDGDRSTTCRFRPIRQAYLYGSHPSSEVVESDDEISSQTPDESLRLTGHRRVSALRGLYPNGFTGTSRA